MKALVRLAALSLFLFASGAWAAININQADAKALEALNGVGPAKAQAIVDYRKQNGPFKTADELVNVRGIGPTLLEKNRANISVTEQGVKKQ